MHALRALRTWAWVGLVGLPACDAPLDPQALVADAGEADDADAAPEDAWDDPLPLVSGQAWAPADAEHDPLADERPPAVDCPPAAWGLEAGGLEIQTGACNYFFVTQPSLAAIEAGDAIDIVVFHQYLDAPEPAEGHVAILVGDEIVWEAYVEIPSEADVLEARVVAGRDWSAGTPVGVHLHNHGYNAWTVLDVSTAPKQR